MNLNTLIRFLVFIDLNASAGMRFAPGDLLFFRPLMAFVNSCHVIGLSSVGSVSRWWISVSAFGETIFLLLNNFSQCGCSKLMFSLLFVAAFPVGSVSFIDLGCLWLISWPMLHSFTASHMDLVFCPERVCISSAFLLQYRALASLTV